MTSALSTVGPAVAWADEIAKAKAEAISGEPDWEPLPWQAKPLADSSSVVLLTGSAGGGKSRLWQEMVHRYCMHPDHKAPFVLVARKTRESMTAGAMLALAEVAEGAAEPAGSMLRYRNGSIVAFVGMKDANQRTRIRSVGRRGDVDMVVMEEGNEFIESDFNELRARLRGKAAPYRQMIVATNPDAPTHWIYARLIVGASGRGVLLRRRRQHAQPARLPGDAGRADGHRVRAAGQRPLGAG